MTKTYAMNALVEKMQSPDQDFRYMGLNDLINEIKTDPSTFVGDESTENKVLLQVLALVQDKISEVKNQAVKCLGQLIKILRQHQMEMVVDKLIDFSGGKDEELRDISSLALKTITAQLPADSKIAILACGRLTPKLLAQAAQPDTPSETLVESLSILSILVSRFPTHSTAGGTDVQALNVLPPLLSHPRPMVRKRTIVTLSQFISIAQPSLFGDLYEKNVAVHLSASAPVDQQRTTVQLVAAIVRQSPALIAPKLDSVIPGIIAASQKDDDELRESCLQSLEALLLRCPTETLPFLNQIVQLGNKFIKYDPNYSADNDDEDAEMVDADEDEDDAELDEFSDDEDTSYKTRRAATKLLVAFIETRPELLASIYKEVSPVLISRFGEREETVRLEIWAAYGILLRQTSIYGGLSDTTQRGKRKRDADVMDIEGSPYALLKTQSGSLSKALLGQLKLSKTSPTTLQAGFKLLQSLLTVLPGCLANQVPPLITTCKNVLSQSPIASNSSLHLTVLGFLSLFFATHSSAAFSGSLSDITPVLLNSLRERHPRIASETFRVFFSLLNALKPVKSGDWADRLYDEALTKLGSSDLDSEVIACAQDCIGELWICATDVVTQRDRKEWSLICKTTGRTENAVLVVTKVGRNAAVDDGWVNGCVEWLMTLLKKSGKAGKNDIFVALEVLLDRYSTVPPDLAPILVPQIKSYVSTADISLLAQALSTVSRLLQGSPKSAFPEVERDLLTDIYVISHSSLVSGVALDALLSFFASLVQADRQISTHIVPNLTIAIEKKTSKEGAAPGNVAKCIAQVVKADRSVAAGAIAEYAKSIKANSKTKISRLVLSLLILGEIGRIIDMSQQPEIFRDSIQYFIAEEEEVRTAAAFCAGNISIGNLQQFLPVLVNMVQNDSKKRLVSLHALKEAVTHCSHGQLESVADMLWAPLFEHPEATEDSTRNVAAACLGKLATTRPSRYLPQLHARTRDDNATTKAIVVSAIRYTLSDTDQSYDELLAPLLNDFLELILDEDLTVRRLALSTLNSAARIKPQLIQDHLPSILPNLYKETYINPDLIRTVQMGPWQHKVDDGLEARKTAYETMYTLLDTSLTKLDLHVFLGRVIAGLTDGSDEIKVISYMLLVRLSQVAPATVSQHLDEAAPALEKTMEGAIVTKDTVKQDLERASELQRSALRAVVALSKVGAGVSPKFDVFTEGLRNNATWGPEFKDLEANSK